ncbi:MAG: hypothetical protein ACK2UI_14135, partial [Anaerolineae bacterium]
MNTQPEDIIIEQAAQVRISNALQDAFDHANAGDSSAARASFDLASDKYVIFSDLHKGTRNRADDFWRAERAYNAALAYYYRMGYTLVLLGDIEELWEERPRPVL